MDKVKIREFEIEAIVGLYPWERVVRQTLLLDIDLAADIRQAAMGDDLRFTVDYSAVCEAVTVLAQQGKFKLIETLGEKVAQLVIQQFSVSWVRVAVHKMDVMTHVRRVGVEIERTSADYLKCHG